MSDTLRKTDERSTRQKNSLLSHLCCLVNRWGSCCKESVPECSTEGCQPDFELQTCGALRRCSSSIALLPTTTPAPGTPPSSEPPSPSCDHPISPTAEWLNPFSALRADVALIREDDPALHSSAELIFYPSLYILFLQRCSHWLYRMHLFWLARLLNFLARGLFGADVHPGARIYPGVFIDHALGVVIGETAIIGSGTIIYQGATIGGTGHAVDGRRHPLIGERSVVGSGAKVLGPLTIGRNARIGANAVVLRDVGCFQTVVGIPARCVKGRACGVRSSDDALEHRKLPDLQRVYEKRVDALSAVLTAILEGEMTDDLRQKSLQILAASSRTETQTD